MSRNFDLLQRAQSLIHRTALFNATLRDTSAVPYSDQSCVCEPAEELWSEEAAELWSEEIVEGRLPCLGLSLTQKQQMAKLVASVFLRKIQKSSRIVAVLPVGVGCSSARITACAAEVLADQSFGPVCVVDADLHNRELDGCFGLSPQGGFPDLACSSRSVRRCSRRVANRLWVLSAGAAGKDILGGEATRTCLAKLRNEFAYALLVCPPLLNSPDVLALAAMADGVLLVIQAGVTRRVNALAATKELLTAKVPVLGAVLEDEPKKEFSPAI